MLDIFNSADFIVFTTRDFAGYSGDTAAWVRQKTIQTWEKQALLG